MDFSKLAGLSIGLAAFLGGLWIVLQIIKTLRRNNNEKQSPLVINAQPPRVATAGEQSSDYWQQRFNSIENELRTIKETLTRIEGQRR